MINLAKPSALMCLLLAGCTVESTTSSDSPTATVSTDDTQPGSGLAPEQINLIVGDEKKLEEMVAAHKGEVVFVDYWATWCEPCVEYFPHTVEMHRKYKDKGLATIGVSFDFLEEEATARKFLADQGADFEHLLNSYGAGSEYPAAFDLDQIPHFRLYNRKGELVKKWDKKPEDADKLIEELLAEEAASPAAEASSPAPSESAGKTEE